MVFHSFPFVAFFAGLLLLTLCLPHRWRNACLLAASYAFYAAWSWNFLALLGGSTLLGWVAGRAIGASRSTRVRRAWLAASLVGHLGTLCFFKYYDFFVDALDALLLPLGTSVAGLHLGLVLPLGISFYTLQTLGYTLDVYRGHFRPVQGLPDFALFVGFFPQILAGPIARARQLVPQVQSRRRIDSVALREGAFLALWGTFKKVVLADNLARIVDPVFARGASPDGLAVVVATLGFSVLVYADFSGYTDIARGTARMLGFELVRNFDTPYLSRDMGELWRRWHMSLTSWLRDYLFLSLGGGRVGRARLTVNLWTTLFVCGLWHGSTGSFALFGVFHGTLVAATYWYRRLRPVRPGSARWPGALGTFLLFALSLTAFRAEDGGHALSLYATILEGVRWDPAQWGAIALVAICSLPLLATDLLQRRAGHDLYVLGWPLPARVLAYVAIFYAIVLFGRSEGYEFLYFQF
jgi:D-alanyl-lipoteichoic acid acyltransferase DltB (MBOAT superfamily)